MMVKKPTYEELAQRVRELEKESFKFKWGEEVLHQEKKLADGIINSLPGLFYMFDEEQFVRWNKKWEIITGYSPEELGGMYGPDFFEGADREHIADRMQEVFREGASTAEAELMTKDGRRIPYYFTGLRMVFDEKPYLIGMGIDIADRKLAEEALRESEKLYRLLADNVTDVIWVRDMNLGLTYVSPSIIYQTGYTVEETMARTLEEALTPGSLKLAVEVFIEELEIEKDKQKDVSRSRTIEVEVTCKDGSTIWTELKMSFLRDQLGNPTGIIGVTRNITERKTLLAEAMRVAHLSSLGELAAGVAHEINNPITGIIGYAEILSDSLNEKDQDTKIPNSIIREAERVAKIVKNLLYFARDRNEEYSPAYIKDILSDTLSLIERQIIKDNIKFSVEVPDDLHNIKVRSKEIQQVFLNLISNARYALNQKFPKLNEDKFLKIKCETIEIEGRNYVRTTFYDGGIGIPANILNRISDPFFSTKPTGEGTGLGLSISHGIIKNHDGRLWFESVEGKYTKSIVDIPVDGGLKLEE
jgi:PAS domain S-box-containing protein